MLEEVKSKKTEKDLQPFSCNLYKRRNLVQKLSESENKDAESLIEEVYVELGESRARHCEKRLTEKDKSNMLRLRKSKLLPQQVSDLGAFIFVVAMIPVSRKLLTFACFFFK